MSKRMRWVLAAGCLVFVALVVYALFIEPHWIRTRHVHVGDRGLRIVHITDVHHRGGRNLARAVDEINRLAPDFVCFTGDLVENWRRVASATAQLRRIRCPVYGVPGNHDFWSRSSFAEFRAAFEATGGEWLTDKSTVIQTAKGPVTIVGSSGRTAPPKAAGDGLCILLCHYPAIVNRLGDRRFDLILAGHSHGGQVRLPFIGAPLVPDRVRPYDRGLYQTKAGPLYVNPGLGALRFGLRFGCRPEITVIDL